MLSECVCTLESGADVGAGVHASVGSNMQVDGSKL